MTGNYIAYANYGKNHHEADHYDIMREATVIKFCNFHFCFSNLTFIANQYDVIVTEAYALFKPRLRLAVFEDRLLCWRHDHLDQPRGKS